ncbi:MAG: tetratricopeptide repeat protein [Anaerolineae bacterium]|nr:tetratricopeptide repeat protein [Anaerolineae bacterium]
MILSESGNGAYFHFVLEEIPFGWIKCIVRAQITDIPLRQMIQLLTDELEKAYAINESWTNELLHFFDLSMPASFPEMKKFRKMIDARRKAQGAAWMERAECQALATKMQQIILEINQLTPPIYLRMGEVYGDLYYDLLDNSFGTQEAKDLIDMGNGESDPQQAIKLFQQALTYGETGIQASKAFMELGMRYEDLGETEQAIEHYTRSLTAWKPFGFGYFWRGRLYYARGQWEQARSDIERALNFASESMLPSPEREEAEEYLVKLNERNYQQ